MLQRRSTERPTKSPDERRKVEAVRKSEKPSVIHICLVINNNPLAISSLADINMNRKKVLLMGKSGSGKTSMRSIIFANFIARDTRRLGATIDVEHSHVRLLGNLVLNLWDCGGQEAFMENYFASQRDNIFRNVEVLIYVFDVESRELEKDLHYYQSCLEAILQNSPEVSFLCQP